jgi:hypothetical protein
MSAQQPKNVRTVKRRTWGAVAPKRRTLLRNEEAHGVAIHYSGMNADEERRHENCARRVRAIQRYHMQDRGWNDIAYCADAETEILTQRGFVGYADLSDRDVVLTLNHVSGVAEWQRLLAVNVFDDRRRPMILMEGASHSSLTTRDHSWPVERYVRRFRTKLIDRASRTRAYTKLSGEWVRMLATSESLHYFDRIPATRPCANIPTESVHADPYVELLSWFWTEGQIRLSRGKPTTGVAIYQSHEVNAPYVERIRACLHDLYGPPAAHLSKQGDTVPRWRECVNGHKMEFFLNHVAGAQLLAHAPEKVVSPAFVASLTASQLRLFIDTAVAADGSSAPAGTRVIAQKDPRRLEALQMACALVGFRTNLTRAGAGYPNGGRKLSIFKGRRNLAPIPAVRSSARFLRQNVIHEGPVWCPTTPNGTWFARRRGTTYFTGNSHLVCRHGYVFVGRGFGVRSAANGTKAANDRYFAVCFLGDDTARRADVTPAAYAALGELLRSYDRRIPRAMVVRPHSDFVATPCPGDELRRYIARRGWAAVYSPRRRRDTNETSRASRVVD